MTLTVVLCCGAEHAGAPVIDFHGHLDPRATARIDRIMRAAGIELIVNLSGGNFSSGMRGAVGLTRAMPGKVVNFYTPDWADIDEPWWAVREAQRLTAAVRQYGFRGLKISKTCAPPTSTAQSPICSASSSVTSTRWFLNTSMTPTIATSTRGTLSGLHSSRRSPLFGGVASHFGLARARSADTDRRTRLLSAFAAAIVIRCGRIALCFTMLCVVCCVLTDIR